MREFKDHLMGKELPYIPYLSEELVMTKHESQNIIHGFHIKASKSLSKGERVPINLGYVMLGLPPTGFYVSPEEYLELKKLFTSKRKNLKLSGGVLENEE